MRGASLFFGVMMVSAVGLVGCHSPYVQATVHNATGGAITVMEVDYPSASFGAESLAAGQDYDYRFKIQGSGPLKVMWTDASNHDHTVGGPQLHDGEEGKLEVTLLPATAKWNLQVHPEK